MNRLLLIACLCGFGTFAQTDSIHAPYFEEFEDKISLQLFMLNTSNSFVFDYEDEAAEVDILPNSKTTINLGVQYDIISFSFGFAPHFLAENKDNKESKIISTGLTINPQKWMQHLEVYYQKGMTVENPNGTAELYFPGFKSLKIAGSTSYFFNGNFSFRAIALQNVRQLRSAGSFVPSLHYSYTKLDATKVKGLEGEIDFVDLALTPGYYYNWAIGRHFLLSSGAAFGVGVTRTQDGEDTFTAALYQGHLFLAPGYNSQRWFFGANARIQFAEHKVESNVDSSDVLGYFVAFAGYRFDAPDFLTENAKKIRARTKL